MNGTNAAGLAGRSLTALREQGLTLKVFAGTLCLSAFLLFSVQPMFARMVLPRLGGSPSVWAVSMCFFQAVLLLGYCYAHGLNRYVRPGMAILVHMTLLGAGFLALPIALGNSEPPAGDAYLWLVGVLALGVGLPFFAVSATAPLLQSWFSRTGHPHAADPYFLYGASNLGSLAALLAYPVLIEPLFGLGLQSRLWSAGFVMLAAAILFAGAILVASGGARERDEKNAIVAVTPRPAWHERALWVGLAAVPSGLLVAFTTFLTTDIASAPFLWVLPLALFLLTFIMVFKEKPTIPHAGLVAWLPRLVAFAVIGLGLLGDMGWYLGTAFGLLAFIATALVCHRELYLKRPAPEHLTEFYLWMSLGGVLGGVFAALLAPQLFNSILEFPLLMAAGLLLRPGVLKSLTNRGALASVAIAVGAGVAMLLAIDQLIAASVLPPDMRIKMVLVVLLACGILLFSDAPARQLSSAALVVLALGILPFGKNVGEAERSFFGVHRVVESADGRHRLLFHGVTMHGAMRVKDAADKPVAEPLPATYYHPKGTMARGIELARALLGPDAKVRIGIVGLGTGAMACNGKPGDDWKFYEIDPVVVSIAKDRSRFSFLSRCTPSAPIVVGDARLTLSKEKPASFDYLVVDAFSSDAIPVHLLTVEALELYLSKLSDKGVLALHVSNRHLDLPPIVAATAAKTKAAGAVYVFDLPEGPAYDASASQVILIAKDKAALEAAKAMKGARLLTPGTTAAWTDDYSNILGAIIAKRLK
ncbi:MAG: hypothetical protein F9K44_03445 [Hyphomicrobiaceae bacterium]|nr:MAG: hypothetical protein F9K44_03445 [Hyphomicrobiaceae bacterium]